MCLQKSFAFSGCGWLLSFHLGVIHSMRQRGLLTEKSVLAGTSGGAIAAVIGCSGMCTLEALDHIIKHSQDKSFMKNIDLNLRDMLWSILPSDAVDQCNHRLYICSTRLFPDPLKNPVVVSEYKNRKHLVDVVAASSFIPRYSDPKRVFTRISDVEGAYIDGGVLAFMPPIGDIKVSPMPRGIAFWRRRPSISLENPPYSIRQLMKWVLVPAPPDVLRDLYARGQRAGDAWIETNASNPSITSDSTKLSRP